ncbi:MAG: hypothetical protein IKZ29_03120 [Clostridiales bacterium]|nr:hypothetical protein [Clostridiales bacterium]
MNKRKIAMMAAAVLSIITVFLPYFVVETETLMGGIPIMGRSPRLLITNFSGVAILVTGLVIIGFVIDKLKKGVIVASALNLASLFWGFIEMARLRANMETAAVIEERYIDIRNGPALFFLFVAGAAVIGATACYVWYMVKLDE